MHPRSEISRAGTCDGMLRDPPWFHFRFALRHDSASSNAAGLTPSVPVALDLHEDAFGDIVNS